METPPTTPVSDRFGNELPLSSSADDLDRLADQLRILSDSGLPPQVMNRVPLDSLERRRLKSLGR